MDVGLVAMLADGRDLWRAVMTASEKVVLKVGMMVQRMVAEKVGLMAALWDL